MNKICLLILAIVVALGGLGAGYAMWRDEIQINGTVTTGSVDMNVSPNSYTGTYVFMVTTDGQSFAGNTYNKGDQIVARVPGNATQAQVDAANANNNFDRIAYSNTSSMVNGSTNVDDGVRFTFSNLYPLGEHYAAGFTSVYAGTIPARATWQWQVFVMDQFHTTTFNLADLASHPEYEGIYYLLRDYTSINITDKSNNVYTVHPYDSNNPNQLSNVRLNEYDTLKVEINTYVPLGGTIAQDKLSGRFFGLMAKLVTSQWNLSAPSPDSSLFGIVPAPTTIAYRP
jgi:hypothetical protein